MAFKYKSKVPLRSDGVPVVSNTGGGEDTNIGGVIARGPTREERKQQQQRDREFGDTSDIDSMLQRVRGTIIKQETHLPKGGDMETYDKNEWTRLNKKSHNKTNNTYYSWH
jgi:hypothetical protein